MNYKADQFGGSLFWRPSPFQGERTKIKEEGAALKKDTCLALAHTMFHF